MTNEAALLEVAAKARALLNAVTFSAKDYVLLGQIASNLRVALANLDRLNP